MSLHMNQTIRFDETHRAKYTFKTAMDLQAMTLPPKIKSLNQMYKTNLAPIRNIQTKYCFKQNKYQYTTEKIVLEVCNHITVVKALT